MILSASEISAQQDNRIFNAICDKVMADIKKSSAKGLRQVHFCPRVFLDGKLWWSEYENAVKEEFKARGYYFRPTGYIDGMWQHTENICW